MSSVTGARPTATSRISASISDSFSPCLSVTLTPPSWGSALVSWVAVITFMPRFFSWRSSSFETSSSSIGRMRGSISTSVTSDPNERKTEANSVPTAPAPSTTIDFGMRSISRM